MDSSNRTTSEGTVTSPVLSSKMELLEQTLLFPCLIAFLGFAVYANSIDGPFIYDDVKAIVNNPYIRSLWPPAWLIEAWNPSNAINSRFVVGLSFAINYAIDGLDPTGYHIVNIISHIICALLLMGVVRQTLQTKDLEHKFSVHSSRTAFVVAIIWIVHPMHTETVNYVLQRTESFMALFYLLTFYCFLRGVRGSSRYCWFIAAVVSCALGMGSKETMASAPITLLLFDRIFISDSWKETSGRWKFHASLSATWVLLAILVWRGPHGDTVSASTGLTPWDYLLNQCSVIPHYLWLTVWPHQLNIDYGFPVSDLLLKDQILPGVFLTILFGSTILALFWRPKIGFLGLCFFLLLAPTSSILPILTEVGAERRMYLPLAILTTLLVIGIYQCIYVCRDSRELKKGIQPMRVVSTICLLGIIFALMTRTVHRNSDYEDPLVLWKSSIAILPSNPRAHHNLGIALGSRGLIEDSLEHFRIAAESPNYPPSLSGEYRSQAYQNLGVALLGKNELKEAAVAFQESIELQPNYAAARFNLGVVLARKGDLKEAIPHLQKALQLDPRDPKIHNFLGIALWQTDRLPEAIKNFERALELHPTFAEARENLDAVRNIGK